MTKRKDPVPEIIRQKGLIWYVQELEAGRIPLLPEVMSGKYHMADFWKRALTRAAIKGRINKMYPEK